ncbi:MAG: DUF3794 domain-containing protein [Angelakisella sp.]
MELKLNKQPLFISEMLADTTVEQPLECDALLPDYCPDIVRILKCMVTPTVASRRLNGQRLEIEGMAVIVVLYTSTGEGVQKAEYKVPFAKAVELRGEPAKHSLSVQVRPGYMNCRAVNQRRLDIRGAVTIGIFAIGCREEQVICGGEGAGIELREEQVNTGRLLGQESREVRVTETLELTYGKPPVREVVRCQCVPRLVECKTEAGKVVVKGELAIHLLYQHTNGCDQMDFTVPTAAVIELDGIDEHCMVSVTQEMMFCTLEPCADREGEYRNLTLEAVVLMTAKAECPVKTTCCTDCYSTKCQCSFHTKSYNTLRLEDTLHQPVTLREVMTLPDNIESVVDLWCEAGGVSFRGDQSAVGCEGRVTVCILGKLRDGELIYFDKNLELSERIPVTAANAVVDGRATVMGSGYSFSANDAIEVRCDLMLDGSIYSAQRFTGLDDIVLDEKKSKAGSVPTGLYLYMAGDGEAMWEIAKRYNTSVQRIQEENPQTEGRRGDVLIIPVL